jgi:hypothetical protein
MKKIGPDHGRRAWHAAAKQFAEKIEFQYPAPKGAFDF